ncbi:MAG TPA: hypothetical protein VLF39_02875 [Candidatus Saccharimonadales bacterium]|nr:hypothetical protein [Candidatus Saccharimonadales bacterium]
MSEIIRGEDLDDPFFKSPCAGAFMKEAFAALDNTGSPKISKATQHFLQEEFRIDEGQTAALAYLAAHRVSEAIEEFPVELDLDLKTLSLRGLNG